MYAHKDVSGKKNIHNFIQGKQDSKKVEIR